ncbi:uncharacterized protein Dvir_GJ26914 [Drosophila virilis]|uniref:Uncharacterized protein n=1 Tax=Drosophila virilis TaxID=7244 RepID=A0A0Q9WP37_DROVI|nr:uncharacterized protein Dvir_GJ26914 [Drosophila virilis]
MVIIYSFPPASNRRPRKVGTPGDKVSVSGTAQSTKMPLITSEFKASRIYESFRALSTVPASSMVKS